MPTMILGASEARGIVVRKLAAEVLGTGLLYPEMEETLASGDLPTAAVD